MEFLLRESNVFSGDNTRRAAESTLMHQPLTEMPEVTTKDPYNRRNNYIIYIYLHIIKRGLGMSICYDSGVLFLLSLFTSTLSQKLFSVMRYFQFN